MSPEVRRKSKLARVLGYGAVALIAAWSLVALAGYAVLAMLSGWMASLDPADGWLAWGVGLVDPVGGAVVAGLWLLGTVAILGAMAVLRRVAA